MSQDHKRPRSNPHQHKCDSCGDMQSYRFHNHGFLCYACYSYDKIGMPRSRDGTIVSNEDELKILNDLYENKKGKSYYRK